MQITKVGKTISLEPVYAAAIRDKQAKQCRMQQKTGVSHGHTPSAELASLKLLHLLLGLAVLCKPPAATACRQQQDQRRQVPPAHLHAPRAKTVQVAPPLGLQAWWSWQPAWNHPTQTSTRIRAAWLPSPPPSWAPTAQHAADSPEPPWQAAEPCREDAQAWGCFRPISFCLPGEACTQRQPVATTAVHHIGTRQQIPQPTF